MLDMWFGRGVGTRVVVWTKWVSSQLRKLIEYAETVPVLPGVVLTRRIVHHRHGAVCRARPVEPGGLRLCPRSHFWTHDS
jgi:hypothetical protein